VISFETSSLAADLWGEELLRRDVIAIDRFGQRTATEVATRVHYAGHQRQLPYQLPASNGWEARGSPPARETTSGPSPIVEGGRTFFWLRSYVF
jgi:hypothetical protein